MGAADLQTIADICYHIEGCAAMIVGALGCITGFQVSKFFFERCLDPWM